MPDLTTVTAALSGIKTATDIVNFLRKSDFGLEKAEMKNQMADLIGALADVKLELVSLQDELVEKNDEINALKEAFEEKDSLARKNDAYYKLNEDGEPMGIPYCLRCWEGDRRLRQLVHDHDDHGTRVCTGCGQRYSGLAAAQIFPPRDQ